MSEPWVMLQHIGPRTPVTFRRNIRPEFIMLKHNLPDCRLASPRLLRLPDGYPRMHCSQGGMVWFSVSCD